MVTDSSFHVTVDPRERPIPGVGLSLTGRTLQNRLFFGVWRTLRPSDDGWSLIIVPFLVRSTVTLVIMDVVWNPTYHR